MRALGFLCCCSLRFRAFPSGSTGHVWVSNDSHASQIHILPWMFDSSEVVADVGDFGAGVEGWCEGTGVVNRDVLGAVFA